MRKIKAKTHPNVNITVKVTDEMVKDYKDEFEKQLRMSLFPNMFINVE